METEKNTVFRRTRDFATVSLADAAETGSHAANTAVTDTEATSSRECSHKYLPSRRSAAVIAADRLSGGVYSVVLRDRYIAHHAHAGQFANLYLHDASRIMPRPLGVAAVGTEAGVNASEDDVRFIFAVVGEGTEQLSHVRPGDSIDVLGPLGNGFSLTPDGRYLLVGGGLGVPPLIRAAQEIRDLGASSTALFGYRDVHFADSIVSEFSGATLSIDESEGNVVTLLDRWAKESDDEEMRDIDILSCGPTPMMKAVAAWARDHGMGAQLSLEGRMGCGFGTCVACVTPTVTGLKKVCLDGPVFTTEQLNW
ncbi:MAG: dihydroorotate dehydrogenase electron transfer subunit [Bifidobacteriaceae bacterium]|nr:dihydroorotate dehydrogenase electron transfer subunit [Bifidobacteriaceae bacterium]